ncbi:MAG: type II secretion system protein GspG [Pseudomonadota bacterium]
MRRLSRVRIVLFSVFSTLLISIGTVVATENTCPSYLASSRLQYTRLDLEEIEDALTLYRKEKGVLPETLNSLASSGYLKKSVAADGWHHPYVYQAIAGGGYYALYSRGVDGVDESGNGDDVTAKEKQFTCEQYQELCRSPCEVVKAVGYFTSFFSAIFLLGLGAYFGIRSFSHRNA